MMQTLCAFELHVQAATTREPVRVSVALVRMVPHEKGIVHLTPECMRLDDLESAINALQDELDVLRARAREVFADNVGHA